MIDQAWRATAGAQDSPFLLIADHASNRVPDDIDLGIAADLLNDHIAIDRGVAELGQALCAALNCPGIFANISRLVVDLNREEDAPHIIPHESDGHSIPGNAISPAARAARIARYWRPYHQHIADQIAAQRPRLLISLHSFTPQLQSKPEETRPWEIGILYNQDERAARQAIPALAAQGLCVGDQLPYSGKLLNATMNRHGEANGIAYLGLELRQDQITTPEGVARWAGILAPIIRGLKI
ncbi:MAG: N-formylglutamate amidohydrolase [Sphingomonadaceae bacterium]|jgi:predicted N-formylglutamate amidohydrolase|nr:N-formylglutamate amidohydrolase [Sphingomonadaceae bacterium]NBU77902.1 N-formylglutamate amidohydrolase [Sphingomonadaceae bacterium]NCA01313.1 N-formylglutamate amidohydrolase [Sphingomonadaceae bacterium]